MITCNTCLFFILKIDGKSAHVYRGTCYQSKRRVSSSMCACKLHRERENSMVTKSNGTKRNVYKDKDGNKMPGVTIPEVLEEMVTVLAKREYTWGKFNGLAVKIAREDGSLAVVEVTANFVVKNMTDPKFPRGEVEGKFVEKTSKAGKKYFKFAHVVVEELEF